MPAITAITVTVRGRVAPGTTALSANGSAVTIAADRSWSLPVTVPAGGTLIALTATHAGGRTSVRSLLVESVPAAPAPPMPVAG